MKSRSWFASLSAVFLLGLASLAARGSGGTTNTCTYETWVWDTRTKKSIDHQQVSKLREALTTEEMGSVEGCTVCLEDQEELHIPGSAPFRVCRKYAPQILRALRSSAQEGFQIRELVGYRVGKSKGALDASGRRTQFSNHSYGTAIDVNPALNGLYDHCVQFDPACHLLRGGRYVAGQSGTIDPRSPVYRLMTAAGFRWGGELKGQQKDFMHFSLSGD